MKNNTTKDSQLAGPVSHQLKNFPELVANRIKNFWGYGNLKSDIWFVGMEEGADGDIGKLITRFEATSDGEVFDIYDDMQSDTDHMKWFDGGKPQRTYMRLVYFLLFLKSGKYPTRDEMLAYQVSHFGRKNADHATLELMPLPARSLNGKDWVYAESGIEGLESRRAYLKRYKPERVARLRKLIQEHKPKFVICYSLGYFDDWQMLMDMPLKEVIEGKLYTAKDDRTVYAVVPHAVAHGVFNTDWENIAKAIATV
jgi:hypothetical protein